MNPLPFCVIFLLPLSVLIGYLMGGAYNFLALVLVFGLLPLLDLHYRPNRRYQILRDSRQSPQLPNGYAGMVLLTLVPPLWRKLMDKRLSGTPWESSKT